MNHHQHPATGARQELALQHGSAPTHTPGLRCSWSLLTLLPGVEPSPLPTAHGTDKHGSAHTRAARRQVWGVSTHVHRKTLQWRYYPLAWDAKMSTGKQRLCVSRGRACWRVICLKLTPPALPQWQQVSSQGPDLCELRTLLSTLGTKLFITVTLHTKVIVKLLWWKVFFPCHK